VENVKRMVEGGTSVPTAIKEALGISVTAFADRHGLHRSTTSEVINLDRGPREPICSALAIELGGTSLEWAELLWSAARPKPEQFQAA